MNKARDVRSTSFLALDNVNSSWRFCEVRTFHRSALQGVFVKNLRNQSSAIHFSKRLVSYTDPSLTSGAFGTNPITLHFKDGSSATCDLLVGSDGIRSTIRRQMYTHLMEEAALNGEVEKARELQHMVEPVWSGSVAYRGLVPVSTLSEEQLKEAMKPTIVSHIDISPVTRSHVNTDFLPLASRKEPGLPNLPLSKV